MKFILIFSFSLFFSSCNENSFWIFNKPSSKSFLADKVSNKTALKLKETHQLYPCGSGGQMMDEIKMLALCFRYYKHISIDEARKLLVEATTQFLANINEDEQIQPYLYNHPFTPQNIEIIIYLRQEDGSPVDGSNLCGICMLDGVLSYDIKNSESPCSLATVLKETYEDAVKKLEEAERESASRSTS